VIKRDLKYQQEFGKHLKHLREERNWTQMDLAAVSRVGETQISKIEGGDVGPNLQTIRLLATALGKHPGELFDFEFDLKLNTDFSSKSKRKDRPGTTSLINRLVADNFFRSPKSVADIIEKCKKVYNVSLASADTSGVLLKLVSAKVLKRVPSSTKGKYLYQKR